MNVTPISKSVGGKTFFLELWQWSLLIFSTLVKLSLMGTYHSTDFEVHRNWLAITHSLPLSQWYFDEGSKWTLDYPPFFAYLSWLLSIPAAYWDPKIVDLKGGLEYSEWSCKVFMRLSVIVTELTFITALFALSQPSKAPGANPRHVIPAWCVAALILHPGLIIIDHIHFQYNGFLYGILFWSIWAAREKRPLLCAFLFSSLLNFKHIYVYIAPAFFVFLLQTYVIRGESDKNAINLSGVGERLFTLATITIIPFVASLFPLMLSGLSSNAPAGPIGILKQMVSRLFPFSRGLNHAYWAANAWALYTFTDRALVKLLGVQSNQGNVTRGILGDTFFDVLPQISAGHCFLLTLICTLLLCTRLWVKPTYGVFVQSIGLFGLTSFLFGFHVHEKAILIALLPLTLLSACSYTMMRKTLVLSVAGIVGLFPLLFEPQELPIKIIWTFLWLLNTPFSSTLGLRFSSSSGYFDNHTPTNVDLLIHFAEDVYIFGFVPLLLFVEIIHPLIFGQGAFSLNAVPSSISAASFSSVAAQNRILSFASAAASSAVGAIQQAVGQQSSSSTGLVEGVSSSAVSAASIASSAASSIVKAASESVIGTASVQEDQLISQAASSASSIASAAISAVTDTALIQSQNQNEPAFAFLPLMMTSIYCAIGVVWVWFSVSARFLRGVDDIGEGEFGTSKTTKVSIEKRAPSMAGNSALSTKSK